MKFNFEIHHSLFSVRYYVHFAISAKKLKFALHLTPFAAVSMYYGKV